MISWHLTKLHALGKELLSKERQYVDDCVLIMSLIMMNLYDTSSGKVSISQISLNIVLLDIGYLEESVAILQMGLKSSPSNFHMKLFLIRLYNTLSIFEPAISLSESLDIKQIMLDTLTYVCADDLEFIAPIDAVLPVFSRSNFIYASNEREV